MHTSRRASRQANLLGALAIAVVDRLHEARAHDDGRGLTATAALSHLRLRPGQNIDFLARLLHISHPATIRLVNRLEDRGLLTRILCADDRRGIYTELTASGIKLLEQARPTHDATRERALAEAQEIPELATLVDALPRLHAEVRAGA